MGDVLFQIMMVNISSGIKLVLCDVLCGSGSGI